MKKIIGLMIIMVLAMFSMSFGQLYPGMPQVEYDNIKQAWNNKYGWKANFQLCSIGFGIELQNALHIGWGVNIFETHKNLNHKSKSQAYFGFTFGITPRTFSEKVWQNTNERIGSVANDGWRSNATGSGACSGHGGVAYWLYKQQLQTNHHVFNEYNISLEIGRQFKCTLPYLSGMYNQLTIHQHTVELVPILILGVYSELTPHYYQSMDGTSYYTVNKKKCFMYGGALLLSLSPKSDIKLNINTRYVGVSYLLKKEFL